MSSATSAAAAGTCVDPVWIDQPAAAAVTRGPDFIVAHFKSQYGSVHVYEGCCSEVARDRKEIYQQKDGETIFRMFNDKGFSGYLTIHVQKIDGTDWEHQAHFFGAGLRGDDRDRAFFNLVRLGSAAEKLCAVKSERG